MATDLAGRPDRKGSGPPFNPVWSRTPGLTEYGHRDAMGTCPLLAGYATRRRGEVYRRRRGSGAFARIPTRFRQGRGTFQVPVEMLGLEKSRSGACESRPSADRVWKSARGFWDYPGRFPEDRLWRGDGFRNSRLVSVGTGPPFRSKSPENPGPIAQERAHIRIVSRGDFQCRETAGYTNPAIKIPCQDGEFPGFFAKWIALISLGEIIRIKTVVPGIFFTMSIHDNLIYKAFIDFTEKKEVWFGMSFKTDSTEPRYIRFYDKNLETIETINIDLPHNEFLIQAEQFKAFYRKMRESEMDDT